MSREKTLLKNTIIYATGNFGSKILSFLLLPFYTHYLSTNDYGYFDLITSAISLLIPIITFEINEGLYRYLLDAKNDEEVNNYVSNSFYIVVRNLLIFNLVYLFFVQIKSFQFEYIILLQVNLNIISGFWAQIARGLRNNAEYSVSGIISTIVTLGLNIIFITVMNLRVGSLIFSSILSSIAVIIYLDYKLKIHRYLKLNINKKIKNQLLVFSIPLIPNVISWWFMNVSDRYFLAYFVGIEANGIYAIANKFPSILMMVNSIFSLAWQESAISEYESDDRDKFYTKMFDILISLEFASIIILLAFTKLMFRYLVDIKFFSAWVYVPFLYFGAVFSIFSSFYSAGYLSAKDTKAAFYTSIFGGLVNVILNIILIPLIGIQGASISTMISLLVMWVTRAWHTKKYFRVYINIRKIIMLFICCIVFIFTYFNNNKLLEFIMMFLAVAISLLLNRKLIKKLSTKLKRKR